MTKGGLSATEIEDLRESFAALDQDGSGTLSRDELATLLMRSMGQRPSAAELDRIMARVDTDGSGTVDFDEFAELMASGKNFSPVDTLREVFGEYDTDKDGCLKRAELRKMLANLCDSLDGEELDALIKCCEDKTKGKPVSFEVFIKSVTS